MDQVRKRWSPPHPLGEEGGTPLKKRDWLLVEAWTLALKSGQKSKYTLASMDFLVES